MINQSPPIDYGPLLQAYQLQVNFIEDYGKVKKIYTDRGVYALKELDDPTLRSLSFIQSIQRLYQKGFMQMVPVYRTVDGQYTVQNGSQTFYLMPWLVNDQKEERDIRYHKLFQELANMHALSSHEVKVTEDDIKKHYDQLTTAWDQRKEELENFIGECEKRIYMSPFELSFCTFYQDAVKAIDFGRGKLDDWYEQVKEKEKMRLVTIHGKLSPKHFVYDNNGNGYFINLEKSKAASPIYDLVSFYSRSNRTYPIPSMESYDWFTTYQQHFKLTGDEMLLLHSYLAFPESVYRAISNYNTRRSERDEVGHVRSILYAFWQLKNIEQLNIQIVSAEQQKKLDEEAAAQSQS
ncbi:spore coat protein YsxE [Priestia koreensis]|uniref:spore coat protein YsxE n=1 Tax=Priestia koreensis TaxID=284581 RepID=UPI00203D5D90|nr:spore coat protein YsxE [Priestia koreensis]MCM3002669.1 spore coat protein YsxE [Priestia koreensis]